MANVDLSVPTTQRVAIFEKAGGPVVIRETPVVQQKDLKPGQVLVKVRHLLLAFVLHSHSRPCLDHLQ